MNNNLNLIYLEDSKDIDILIDKKKFSHLVLLYESIVSTPKINIRINRGAKCRISLLILCNLDIKMNIDLEESEGYLDFNSLSIASNENQNIDLNVNHCDTHTFSQIYCCGVADNQSKIKIHSNVYIKEKMAGVITNQKIKGCLLDNYSIFEADPILLIDCHDVNASHQTAIGKMNEEALFYLMSRGINKIEARKMLLNSLISPVIDTLEDEKIKNKILKKIGD